MQGHMALPEAMITANMMFVCDVLILKHDAQCTILIGL